MAEGKIKINVSIAGRSYPMTIDASIEEVYREAARNLNQQISEYSKMANFDMQDRIALSAMRVSIKVLMYERNASLGDEDVEELRAIKELISSHIKR